eukprot:3347443-Lingulodinium_polyedra.AAC.1
MSYGCGNARVSINQNVWPRQAHACSSRVRLESAQALTSLRFSSQHTPECTQVQAQRGCSNVQGQP